MAAHVRKDKVRRLAALALAAALWLGARGAWAEPAPIADPAGPPGATPAAQGLWARFIGYDLARAFALGPNGEGGAAWRQPDTETAKAAALAACARRAGAACRLYAVDLAIVDPARPWRPATEAPASLGIGGFAWAIAPDARYLWHGAEAAGGAVVFGHGRGGNGEDYRGLQPPPWVRRLNLAGFDVLRFDRHPNSDDARRAAAWLREGLRRLRALGYRRIVAAGQSRGGWTALEMLDTDGLADVVIAVAAAAHGLGGSMNLGAQTDQLRAIVAGAAAPRARVAFVQFAGDPFVLDPEGRAGLIRDRLAPRVAAVLLIDRPEGLAGHGAGQTTGFADRFGACLAAFATAPVPPASC